MSGILVNLIIQAIGGAIGGNAIGATLKNMDLGPLGNTIAGALAARAAVRSSARSSRRSRAASISAPWRDSWSAAAPPARS
jgi:hypothetical protein